jgi:hypothetical protein
MPYLLQAAFWVGVIGTVAALPLLGAFMLSSPAALIFIAASAFSAAPPEEAA